MWKDQSVSAVDIQPAKVTVGFDPGRRADALTILDPETSAVIEAQLHDVVVLGDGDRGEPDAA